MRSGNPKEVYPLCVLIRSSLKKKRNKAVPKQSNFTRNIVVLLVAIFLILPVVTYMVGYDKGKDDATVIEIIYPKDYPEDYEEGGDFVATIFGHLTASSKWEGANRERTLVSDIHAEWGNGVFLVSLEIPSGTSFIFPDRLGTLVTSVNVVQNEGIAKIKPASIDFSRECILVVTKLDRSVETTKFTQVRNGLPVEIR